MPVPSPRRTDQLGSPPIEALSGQPACGAAPIYRCTSMYLVSKLRVGKLWIANKDQYLHRRIRSDRGPTGRHFPRLFAGRGNSALTKCPREPETRYAGWSTCSLTAAIVGSEPYVIICLQNRRLLLHKVKASRPACKFCCTTGHVNCEVPWGQPRGTLATFSVDSIHINCSE